jgi:hypothetical protein
MNALFSGTVYSNIALGLVAVKGMGDASAQACAVHMPIRREMMPLLHR